MRNSKLYLSYLKKIGEFSQNNKNKNIRILIKKDEFVKNSEV